MSKPLVVDADGHFLEPPDLWDRYLEPKFRDRAMRVSKDEKGLEYLEIDRRMSLATAAARWARSAAPTRTARTFRFPANTPTGKSRSARPAGSIPMRASARWTSRAST